MAGDFMQMLLSIVKKSWMIKKQASLQLLQHEQKHFDLMQASALDFLYTLSQDSDYTNVLNRYRFINDSISRHYKELQRQYDYDTNHGQESDKQRIWEERIRVMLDSLGAKVPNSTFIDVVTNK